MMSGLLSAYHRRIKLQLRTAPSGHQPAAESAPPGSTPAAASSAASCMTVSTLSPSGCPLPTALGLWPAGHP
jgi:hypothetical protein